MSMVPMLEIGRRSPTSDVLGLGLVTDVPVKTEEWCTLDLIELVADNALDSSYACLQRRVADCLHHLCERLIFQLIGHVLPREGRVARLPVGPLDETLALHVGEPARRRPPAVPRSHRSSRDYLPCQTPSGGGSRNTHCEDRQVTTVPVTRAMRRRT